MYERFQVEQKPGFASGTERYLLRWKFSMTTGGIEIDIGQRQHGAKRALCSAQRVPEPDPLPGISLDTRPDPIQF